jgi:hypothetical protein
MGCDIFVFENRIVKPIKMFKKGRKEGTRNSNRGSEFDQSPLHACMEISQ